jgi:hypothetical protein
MLPDKDTIAEIFSIVKALNDTEKKAQKEFTKNARFRGQRAVTWVPTFSFIAAVILCFLSKLLEIQLLFKISFGFLVISYSAYIISQLFITFKDIWNYRNFLRDPLDSMLDNTRRYAETHVTHVNNLYNYESEALKHVLAELKGGRAAWEKHISLFVGALEKVGIIPGLAALIAIYIRPEISKPLTGWIAGIAYATPVIFGIGLHAHDHMAILDRHIMLIEMVIENKKSVTCKEPSVTLTNGLAPSIASLQRPVVPNALPAP